MAERFTGHGRPSLKQLNNHVVQKVAINWKDLGVELLKDDNSILDIIEADHKQDVKTCCQEMFKKWLQTENASWDQLLEALRSPSVQLVYLANQIEQMLDGTDSTVSMTTSKEEAVNKLITSEEDLEVEFAHMTKKIKQALNSSSIDVKSVVEQLQTFSAVKHKNVPLFDEDVFENVTTVEKLWEKLSQSWSIFDYDLLKVLLRIVECEKANEIFEEFLSRIDVSVIKDLVPCCEEFKSKKLLKPLLRIKVKVDKLENFTGSIKREVEEVVSSRYNLKEYSLRYKGIKEGCIEIVYEISNAMMSYFLQCKFTGHDLAEFAAHNIISLHINDMELQIPSKINMDRIYKWSVAVQNDDKSGIITKETHALKGASKGGSTQTAESMARGIAFQCAKEASKAIAVQGVKTIATQTTKVVAKQVVLQTAKAAVPVGLAIEGVYWGYEINSAHNKKKRGEISQQQFHDIIVEKTATTGGSAAGGIGGGVAGATVGAVVGSVVPVVGTAIGGVVGGLVGGIVGGLGGSLAGKGVGKAINYARH